MTTDDTKPDETRPNLLVRVAPMLKKALDRATSAGHDYVEFHSVDKELVCSWCRRCGALHHVRKGKALALLVDEFWYPAASMSSDVEFKCADVVASKVKL